MAGQMMLWDTRVKDRPDTYLCRPKRACANTMAQKYSVSAQMAKKYKREITTAIFRHRE